MKQPPLNNEPIKKPTSGVPKPDQVAPSAVTAIATAVQNKVDGAEAAVAQR